MSMKELSNQFDEYMKDFTEKTKAALGIEFKEFFDKNPEIKLVCWSQYTPYFNDGDECTFIVYDRYCSNSDKFKREFLYGESEEEDDNISVTNLAAEQGGRELDDGITKMTKFMKIIFGDHVYVVARRDGTFDVEDYDHE